MNSKLQITEKIAFGTKKMKKKNLQKRWTEVTAQI